LNGFPTSRDWHRGSGVFPSFAYDESMDAKLRKRGACIQRVEEKQETA
jgi:hypothetical protein